MATSREYVDYVCERLARFGDLTMRKMFGEYMVYLNDKPVFLVCDNAVFVKCLDSIASSMRDAPLGAPYEGAKTHYILDIDDSALLDAVVPVLERETPVRRKKSK